MNEHLSVLGINLATLLDKRLRYVKKVRNHCARVITVDGNLKWFRKYRRFREDGSAATPSCFIFFVVQLKCNQWTYARH